MGVCTWKGRERVNVLPRQLKCSYDVTVILLRHDRRVISSVVSLSFDRCLKREWRQIRCHFCHVLFKVYYLLCGHRLVASKNSLRQPPTSIFPIFHILTGIELDLPMLRISRKLSVIFVSDRNLLDLITAIQT